MIHKNCFTVFFWNIAMYYLVLRSAYPLDSSVSLGLKTLLYFTVTGIPLGCMNRTMLFKAEFQT